MATTKTLTPEQEEAKRKRSEAAKKAAQTRAANKAKKEAEEKAKLEQQKEAKQEQTKVAEAVADQPLKICDVICETLLLIRPGSETEARPKGEGYSYKECLSLVLEKIRPTNPDAKTSLDCLRWYATKMRTEGTVLPYRPRNAPVRKAVDPTE